MPAPDVVVVGSGNAALCAAIAAADAGATPLVLEAGGEDHFGGNSRYSAGAMRFAYEGGDAIRALLAGVEDPRIAKSEFGAYPAQQFKADLARFNGGLPLAPLQIQLVDESYPTLRWLIERGVPMTPIFDRQSFEKEGRYHFWGGLSLAAEGEGEALVRAERDIAERAGATIRLGCRVVSLREEGGVLRGLRLKSGEDIDTRAVVLASGGFEASPEMRAHYLGDEWRAAVVRGTPFNRGEGLRMALELGAATRGNFAGCHAVCMDVATPSFSDSTIPHRERKNFRKISYPFGIMINARGERFVDEGADFRNYTYAQYGREVLRQPGAFAWQLFDAACAPLLYDEYEMAGATRVEADTLEALVGKLDGVDADRALATLRAYNASVDASRPFDPTRKDGRGTRALPLPKSNWAQTLSQPPLVSYRVTCGVTFTYGGLAIDESAAVLGTGGAPIPGLYAAGEIVGGLFYDGYPGGSGLSAGAVFGRAAGRGAAAYAMSR